MTRGIATAAAAAAWALAFSGPALAQGTGGEAAALRAEIDTLRARLDALEAARAKAEPPPVGTDRGGVTLTFSGRINQALLHAEQGEQDQFFVADNDASGSRFGLTATTELGGLATGVEIEVSAEVNSTAEIDFGSTIGAEDDGNALGDFRQAHWFIEGERFGYLSIGQGDTAAEDTAHADLSGTDLAGAGSDVDDIAGGLVFEDEGGASLAGLADFFVIQDGSRSLRLLYVTPEVGGAALKVSLQNDEESLEGDDDGVEGGLQPAIGLEFGREFGEGGELALEASWRREQSTDLVPSGGAFVEDDREDEFVAASASVRLASGVNVTLAGSRGSVEGQDDDPTAVFAKIGYVADLNRFGETRLSLDYFRGRNAPDFAAPDGDLPRAESVGLFAVQAFPDLNTEAYVGARIYRLDDVWADGAETEVDDLVAVIAGARVRF